MSARAQIPENRASTPSSLSIIDEQKRASAPPVQPAPAIPVSPSQLQIVKFKFSAAGTGSKQRALTISSEMDLQKKWSVPPTMDSGQRTLLVLIPSYDDKWKAAPLSSNVTQVYSGTLQHVILRPRGRSFYLVAHAYHNNAQGMRVEQAYGGGLDKIIDTDRSGSVEFSGDIRFVRQTQYLPGTGADLIGANITGRYSLDVLPKLAFAASVGGTPFFNNASRWEMSGIADITYALSSSFSLVVSSLDNYYQSSPTGFNKNYFRTTFGIQYAPPKRK